MFKFNPDNPFWNALNTVVDMIILNLLYVLCCIPIITIGAATTALYTVTLKLAKKEDPTISREFFSAFASNFRKATLIWLIMLAIGILLALDLLLANIPALSQFTIFSYAFLMLGAVYVMLLTYVFPLQSKFENTVGATIRNAMIMAISNILPWSLMMGFFNLAPYLVVWFNTSRLAELIPVMVIGGFSVIAYINSKILNKIFDRYISAIEAAAEEAPVN